MCRSLTASSWAAPPAVDVTSRPLRAPGWDHENTFVFLVQEWPGAAGLHDREFRNTGVARVTPCKPYDRPNTTARTSLRRGRFGVPPITLPGHGPASLCPKTPKGGLHALSRTRLAQPHVRGERVLHGSAAAKSQRQSRRDP